MSFAMNDIQQFRFDDSLYHLTDREKRILDKSWAKDFAEVIFPAIDERPFSVLYSDRPSRSNTAANVLIGSLILKEMLGLTDEEVVDALMFDIRFQYALHTTSFAEQPLNDRSLGRFRARCISYEEQTGQDLIHECVISLSKEIASVMGIRPNMKRMDSMMVASNIKKMGRLELIYTCVANLAALVNRKEENQLPESLKHYCDADDHNRVLYHNRSEETESKIETVLKDAAVLIQFCGSRYDLDSEYQLLLRVIREQTTTSKEGQYQLKGKGNGSMGSDILQNPSDPDATYCKKAGKENRGYIANVVEDVNENGSVISEYQYEQNSHSDSQFIKEYLTGMELQSEPTILVTDGGFSGNDNMEAAKEKNIQLITTDLKGQDAKDVWADFEFSEDGKKLLHCANGIKPKTCSYNARGEKCRISFDREQCVNCPYQKQCNPKIYKRVARLDLSFRTVDRSKQQRYMGTEEFKKYARFRNGVETIPSILRRKYHVDKMPVRGKIRSKLFYGFKIAALNANKLFKYLDSLNKVTQKVVMA
jgi:hypothetical protein